MYESPINHSGYPGFRQSNSPGRDDKQGDDDEDEVRFFGSRNCCVCFVNIVDSTKITSQINSSEKTRRYYEIFINTMAAIARNFGSKVLKNVGDCLIFYYPETSDSHNKSAFKDVFECCITMVEAHDTINQKLTEEQLPSVSCRISADYGRVEIARSTTSQSDDLFGHTMNMCAKINSRASPNGIVIGDGLYNIVRSISLLPFLEENLYHFEEIGVGTNPCLSQFNEYRVYALQSNKNSLFNQSWQQEQEQEPTHSPNIFLVDDEEDILYTFKKGLSSEGYNVEAFSDSMEALRHFAKVNPSHYKLAILDIRMPGLNGLQLYYRLKTINRNIKILFVSALDAVPELMSILPDVKTKDDIIRKPVALDDFINAVKTALVQ